jgi:squalene-hopene/tetraprenyl-beta-curcumene cyclase
MPDRVDSRMVDAARLETAYQTARAALLRERHPDGYWVGELSSSALSTATAVMALTLVERHSSARDDASSPAYGEWIERGLAWLAAQQNSDGGWGDTDKSLSNISTTMLCRAAFYLMREPAGSPYDEPIRRAEQWLFSRYGSTPAQLAEAVRQRYGKDRTFAVPILTTCALAGLVDWREVPPLPFELACLPQSWFRFLRLHVVSYALPALIAIGQCVHHHKKPWNPLTRLVRTLSRRRSLEVLRRIQPSSGGYLEATPLTSFVVLSLAACGLADHAVVRAGSQFLVNSVRPDGSWPIDTNLSTWVTTLAINALAAAGGLERLNKRDELRDWLLQQQHCEVHRYTGAAPGGWAWTPLPGGVPDADDTPGAMLAIQALADGDEAKRGLAAGRDWLFKLQNGDGGIPTFCRGWGRLAFDRSGCDLTAHALRALAGDIRDAAARPRTFLTLNPDGPWILTFAEEALRYLKSQQRSDGSWLPLWFGNQHMPDDENPTYGTARVLAVYRDLGELSVKRVDLNKRNLRWMREMHDEPARRGVAWLLAHQNDDGGWGGGKGTPSSMEETALAVEILVDVAGEQARAPLERGLAWLVEHVERGHLYNPSPIGFYFAKLWYYEKLYPIIFTVAALGRARLRYCQDPARTS